MFGWIGNNVTKHGIKIFGHDSVVCLDISFEKFNRGWDRRERWRGLRERDRRRGKRKSRRRNQWDACGVRSRRCKPIISPWPATYKGQSHYSDEEKGKSSCKLWYYCSCCWGGGLGISKILATTLSIKTSIHSLTPTALHQQVPL